MRQILICLIGYNLTIITDFNLIWSNENNLELDNLTFKKSRKLTKENK